MARLAEITEAELNGLRKAGIEPSWEEVCWLNDLGRLVEDPQLRIDLRAGCPVLCVDTWLWPFTIQGGQWYTRHACRLFDDPDFLLWCLGFSLALGRSEFLPSALSPQPSALLTFSQLTSWQIAHDAVEAWALRQRFTLTQLRMAVKSLLPELDNPWPTKQRPAEGEPIDLVAELAAGTGQTVEYWRCQMTDTAMAILYSLGRQRAASGGFGGTGPSDSEAYKRAMFDFMAAVDAIRKSRTSAISPQLSSLPNP